MALGRLGAYIVTAGVLVGTIASCSQTANVSDVFMALDAEGNRRRNVFFTDTKEIHCVVELGVGRRDLTLEIIIRRLQAYDFAADRFFDTDRVYIYSEQSPEPATGIQRSGVVIVPVGPLGEADTEAPFEPGRYQCEAYLDGVLAKTAAFNVDFPPCPSGEIRASTLCLGFYTLGKDCPRYGISARDPARCRCTVENGWECDP